MQFQLESEAGKMENSSLEKSEIKDFFKGSKVFVTGATGFVGKTLIEKLLRSTDVDTIYVLIREKKGKTIGERLKQVFQNPVFDVLRKIDPCFQRKIKPVTGECGIPGLGISASDREDLIANVNIVFHAAATVNFDENLKSAYDINVDGFKIVIDMAKEMNNLKSLVFVSTAYSNCIKKTIINEEVYEYPYEEVIEKLQTMTKEEAESCKRQFIGKWPNTYTFTKALAEMLAKRERKHLPIGVFRPSIITSTYKEPIPGWIDNIYAINGVSVGIMMGILRVFPGESNAIGDMVPIDKVISAIIASAKDIYDDFKTGSEIRVYNFTGRNENPLTFDALNFLNMTFGTPSEKALWYPCGVFVSNKTMSVILSFILQIIPALFIDGFTLLTGNKPRLLPIYIKIMRFGEKILFFGARDWEFDNGNVQAMWKKLNKTDQELFPFSMSIMSWPLYCKEYILGIRRYILKEDDSTIEKAFRRHNRLRIAHNILKAVFVFIACSIINCILRKLFNFTCC